MDERTTIYFIRHAESDHNCREDRIRPLTRIGKRDAKKLVWVMRKIPIDVFCSSPYLRSIETIRDLAADRGQFENIKTYEGFREREAGENGNIRREFKKRWSDFNYHEPGGETLGECQRRNIEALEQVLEEYRGKTVVIGTHGTALSTIMNYYDPEYGVDDFYRMMHFLPFVVKMEFAGNTYQGRKEIYKSNKRWKKLLIRKMKKFLTAD